MVKKYEMKSRLSMLHERVKKLHGLREIQLEHYEFNSHNYGMLIGLELAIATMRGEEAVYTEEPKKFTQGTNLPCRMLLDEWGLQLAELTAKRSTCTRRSVGCVLMDSNNHIIATGYNGVARGKPHCNEGIDRRWLDNDEGVTFFNKCEGHDAPSGTNLDACQAIHAEQNALLQCADVDNIATCYTSVSPCITCVKLLLNTNCQKIVFREEYPHAESKKLWEDNKRIWKKL